MDTTQIRQLVAAKIAGQGTNVDAGSALPDIINGLCDIIDNLPTPQELPIVEITEDLGDAPVKISQTRYNELRNTGVLKWGDALYVLINPLELNLSVPENAISLSYYGSTLDLDDSFALNAFSGIVLWMEDGGYYIDVVAV